MSKLIGHAEIEFVKNDGYTVKRTTIEGNEFVLEDGGKPIVRNGETSTWYLFKYIGEDFSLAVDFVEIESRIFSYELKTEFMKKDYKFVDIIEDDLDFAK